MRKLLFVSALTALAICSVLVGVSSAKTGRAAASTINVGLVAPQGTAAFNETSEIGAVNAAVRMLNKTGGFNGHKLKLIYCNDQGDPNQTATCGREMISDKVVGVFGGALLNGGTVLTPMLQKAGIPQIGLTPISGVEMNAPNVYLFGEGGSDSYNVLTAWAAAKHISTSIVYSDNSTEIPLMQQYANILKSKGQSFTSEVPVPGTEADYSPIVEKAIAGNPKAILVSTGPEQAEAFIAAAMQAGYKGAFLQGYSWNSSDIKTLGGGNANVLSHLLAAEQILPARYSNNSLAKQYVASIRAENAAGDKNAVVGGPGGESDFVSTGWLGLWAVAQITKQRDMKTITAKTITAALDKTKKLNMDGIMPPWTPNAKGPKGFVRDAGYAGFYFFNWVNNHIHQLTTTPYNQTQLLAGKANSVKLP